MNNNQKGMLAIGVFAVAMLLSTSATHAAFTLEQKIASSTASFGSAVAISSDGTRAVVSAPSESSTQGAAYVYLRSGSVWTFERKLVASDGAANDVFAGSISITGDGSRVVIGARNKTVGTTVGQGAVYVFSRSGTVWTQEQELTATGGAANNFFGGSVAISTDGTRLIAGAYGASNYDGSAYVFLRSGTVWTQEQKLGPYGGRSGYSVTISGDGSRAAVSAWADNNFKGAVYPVSRTGTVWATQPKLTASDQWGPGMGTISFGNSVSMNDSGSRMVIGAYNASDSVGAAYVFYSATGTTPSWTEEQKLTASDGGFRDYFGSAVAISPDGTRLVAGAYGTPSSTLQGAVYSFARTGTTWAQEQKLTAFDALPSATYGSFVGLSGDGSRIVVGASGATGQGAYIYTGVSNPVTLPSIIVVGSSTDPMALDMTGQTTSSYAIMLDQTPTDKVNLAMSATIALDNQIAAPVNDKTIKSKPMPIRFTKKLNFTKKNWNIGKSVKIKVRQRALNDPNTFPSTIVISHQVTSSDAHFSGITIPDTIIHIAPDEELDALDAEE